MPFVNVMLAIACLALVVVFRSSDRLGAAYGLAVTLTMLADSLVIGVLLRRRFTWPWAGIVPLVALFLIVDGAFLAGNLPKLPQGGYIPVAIALVIFTLFTTWVAGRRRLAMALAALSTPVEEFVREVDDRPASTTRRHRDLPDAASRRHPVHPAPSLAAQERAARGSRAAHDRQPPPAVRRSGTSASRSSRSSRA